MDLYYLMHVDMYLFPFLSANIFMILVSSVNRSATGVAASIIRVYIKDSMQ